MVISHIFEYYIALRYLTSFRLEVLQTMANPICEKCKQTEKPASEINSAVSNTGCAHLYPAVDNCMKKPQGNIASCRV